MVGIPLIGRVGQDDDNVHPWYLRRIIRLLNEAAQQAKSSKEIVKSNIKTKTKTKTNKQKTNKQKQKQKQKQTITKNKQTNKQKTNKQII